MKIKVRYAASETQRSRTFSLDELGLTIDEWNSMPEDKRQELLMSCEESDQPYWAVERYNEDY